MRRETTREDTCSNKVQFLTWRSANKSLRAMLRNPSHTARDAERLHAYRCNVCGRFHIGHYRLSRPKPHPLPPEED